MRLIDADELYAAFRRDVMGGLNYDRILREAKPVDAVPVQHGRWVIRTRHEHYPSGRAYEEIVCPFCGKVDHNGDGNFCGYCGAKMDGKDGEQWSRSREED